MRADPRFARGHGHPPHFVADSSISAPAQETHIARETANLGDDGFDVLLARDPAIIWRQSELWAPAVFIADLDAPSIFPPSVCLGEDATPEARDVPLPLPLFFTSSHCLAASLLSPGNVAKCAWTEQRPECGNG
jgi:hypothetical protein